MLVVVLPDGSGGARVLWVLQAYCEYAFRYFEMLVVVLPDGGGAADGPNVAIGLAEQDFPTTSAPGHQVRPHPAPGLGSPRPHLHRGWARPGHICTETGLTPAISALANDCESCGAWRACSSAPFKAPRYSRISSRGAQDSLLVVRYT